MKSLFLRLEIKFDLWRRQRFIVRVSKNERLYGPHSIVVWRPVSTRHSNDNSLAPNGWWPFTQQLREPLRPAWWRLEI